MTRSGITYAEVALAAENIQLTGEKPTIEKVRAALGGTGSHSTIAKYLQNWRENSPIISSSPKTDGSPAVVQAAVQSVWQQLQTDAATKIKKLEEEIAAEKLLMQEKIKTAEENLMIEKEARLAIDTAFNGLSADHELLKLDLKSLNETHLILTEKYQAAIQLFEDAKINFKAQELLLRESNTHALKVLEEKLITQDNAHAALLSELKIMQETERHHLLVQLDEKRTLLQANDKIVKEKDDAVTHLQTKNADLKIALETSQIENELLKTEMQKNNGLWTYFNDKVVASQSLIAHCEALYDLKASLSQLITQTQTKIVETNNQCKQALLHSLEKEIRRSHESINAT